MRLHCTHCERAPMFRPSHIPAPTTAGTRQWPTPRRWPVTGNPAAQRRTRPGSHERRARLASCQPGSSFGVSSAPCSSGQAGPTQVQPHPLVVRTHHRSSHTRTWRVGQCNPDNKSSKPHLAHALPCQKYTRRYTTQATTTQVKGESRQED